MARRQRRSSARPSGPSSPSVPPAAQMSTASAKGGGPRRRGVIVLVAVVALIGVAILVALWLYPKPKPLTTVSELTAPVYGQPGAIPVAYVKSAACAECHPTQHRQWAGSHHDLAMQPATPETVRGDFNDVRMNHRGMTSRFFKRDGKFFVNTEGPAGKSADFEISYTFGRAAPAVSRRVPWWPPSGPHHRLGYRKEALVPSLPERALLPRRPAPLDGALPELECDVRRLPLDGSEEELRSGDGDLQDGLERDQRWLRGLPRPGRGARRLGACRRGKGDHARGGRTRRAPRARGRTRRSRHVRGLSLPAHPTHRRGATWPAFPGPLPSGAPAPVVTTPTGSSSTKSTFTGRSARARCTSAACAAATATNRTA
jgi:hypothetical protein